MRKTAVLSGIGVLILGASLLPSAVLGQFRGDDRGDRDRGGDRDRDDRGRDSDRGRDNDRGRDGDRGRDSDRDRGGDRREGFSGFGGFGGGPPMFGPPGGFNPADMLRRIDENGNGLIDPSESSGRARFMLDRFARDIPGIDFSKPVSIEKLTRGMERSRDDRSTRSSDSSASSSSSSRPGAKPTEDPLVPGFDVLEEPALPPGFGTRDTSSVKLSDADLREAEDRMRRYDENRDGYLDRNELSRSRWSDDPYSYDQNRDGRLSTRELATRYAKRRSSDSNSNSSSNSRSPGSSFPTFSTNSSSSSSSSSRSSSSTDGRMEMMVRFMMDRYDENKNGVLEKDEWSRSRSDISGADTNKDSQITRDEYTAYMQARMSGGGFGSPGGGPPMMAFGGPGGDGGFSFRRDDGDRGRGDDRRDGGRDGRDGRDGGRDSGGSSFYSRRPSDDNKSSSPTSTASKVSDRKSYRSLTATERLPKGLPEWFARNDANADGQVAMAEYSASWSNSTAKEFSQFDLNNDGMITAKECLQATDAGIARGSSSSSSSTSSDSKRSRGSSRGSSLSSTPAAETTPATSTTSSAPSSTSTSATVAPAKEIAIDSKTMAHFQEVVKKNDKNGDGVLTKDEWVSMPKDPTAADKDKDGKITPTEYAVWTLSK